MIKSVEKYLEKRRKEYDASLTEMEKLQLHLMAKDKRELVGIIIGVLFAKK